MSVRAPRVFKENEGRYAGRWVVLSFPFRYTPFRTHKAAVRWAADTSPVVTPRVREATARLLRMLEDVS